MSNSIPVDDTTHAQVTLLARAWNVTPGQAIARLVEFFQRPVPPAPEGGAAGGAGDDSGGGADGGGGGGAGGGSAGGERVRVHAIYGGVRIAGLYDPVTRALTVTDGPASGAYRTPSGAASAVLQALKPEVNPNRNGWSFWTVDSSGALLQSLRRR